MTEPNASADPSRPLILVVSPFYTAHGGGIERVADKLIQEIGETEDFAFQWAASACDPAPALSGVEMLPMGTTNIIEKLCGFPWPIWSPRSLGRLKKAVARADIVWLHDTLYMGNLLAYYWAQKFNKPIIITQHIAAIPYTNALMRGVMKLAERLFTFRMLQGATQTTFISDRVAEIFYQKVPFSRSIQIIPNGVDTPLFHAPMPEKRAWLRQQFALRDDQPVLLFVGRFVSRKGLDVIHRLAHRMPEWRFWLAGRGPIQPESWHLPNVHVFADRSGATLVELYQAADLLILPSYGEGFPLVIQEALASGLPVLCSPETAAGSHLAEPHLLVSPVWPDDPRRTADSWAGILKGFSTQLPHKHADYNLAEFAASSWSWPVIANAYAEIFKGLKR